MTDASNEKEKGENKFKTWMNPGVENKDIWKRKTMDAASQMNVYIIVWQEHALGCEENPIN